ncbi:MAG: metal ABC transporter substrate-binding protein [Verrucomicrobiota bacterium]
MKSTLLLALITALGCLPTQAKLNVVATTPDIGAIAREVGGNLVELSVLARPTEDPHFVDAKPSFVLKLNHAQVLLEGGAELESGWLPALLDQSRNPRVAAGGPGRVACNRGIAMKEVPTTLDRSQGDIHAGGNPHYLVDPVNAAIVANNIVDAFCQADPGNSAIYRDNHKKFITQLETKLGAWKKTLSPFEGRHVVAYHNSWIYFADRFGLKIELHLEPKPGIPPTPTHLAAVIERMKKDKANVIIVDPYLNRRTAEKVASETGASIVDVSQFPGGVKGTDGGYIVLMDYLINSLAKALAK